MRWLLLVVSMVVAACDDPAPAVDAPPIDEGARLEATDETGRPVTELVLSSTNVGQSSGLALVTIFNRGDAVTGRVGLAIEGEGASDFVMDRNRTTCEELFLLADAFCEIAIAFRPTAAGERVAKLVVSADPGGTVDIALSGSAVLPAVHFEPTSIAIGQREIGTTAKRTLSLVNTGSLAIALEPITATGGGYTIDSTTCAASLAAGATCAVTVAIAAQQLGAQNGEVVAMVAGQRYAAPIDMHGARRVTIAKTGGGTGRVTSTPAGLDCGATCSALFEGAVQLTAAPTADSQLVSWSVAGCGQTANCDIAADPSPLAVTVGFDLVATSTIAVGFAGTGTGEVRIRRNAETMPTSCSTACSVPADPGDTITVVGASAAAAFGGIAGACSAAAGAGDRVDTSCTFVAPPGPSTITATFVGDPQTLWTRTFDAPFHAAAFDTADNLIVASATTLAKLSPTGATIWSQGRTDVRALATAPDNGIYLVTDTELVKLDADGGPGWNQPLVGTCPPPSTLATHFAQCIAVAADGAVAVHSAGDVTRWDATGMQTWSKAVADGGQLGIAIDATGTMLVATNSTTPGALAAARFAVDGSELSSLDPVSPGKRGMLAADATGALVTTTTGGGTAFLDASGFMRMLAVPAVADTAPIGVAIAGADVASLYWTDDVANPTAPWRAHRLAANGNETWSMSRQVLVGDAGELGTRAIDLAGSSTGRIAVVGRYEGLGFQGGWIQVFGP